MSLKAGDICPECKKGTLQEEGEELLCDGCGSKKEKHKKHDSVTRCDVRDWYWEMNTDKLEETPEGFLKGRAAVTNVGVFTYVLPTGGVRRELRLPDEVFSQDSLDSLKLKPITNDHPSKGVQPDSYKALTVGSLGDAIWTDSYRIYAPVLIADLAAVQAVKGGKIALSCGYTCDVEITSGVWMGVPYDAIQRNIRYNHVAIVDKGRAGDDAVLRNDVADGVFVSVQNSQEIKMAKYTIDSAEFEVPEVVASHLVALQGKADQADSDLKIAREDSSRIAAERDTFKDRLDKADAEIADLKQKLDAAPAAAEAQIKARLLLAKTAQDCGVEVKDDMSDLDIKKAVVLAAFPKADLADKDEAYISGRFDGAVEVIGDSKKQDAANAKQIQDSKKQHSKEEKVDSASAHAKYVSYLENAHKSN